jgi:hypothetical protein
VILVVSKRTNEDGVEAICKSFDPSVSIQGCKAGMENMEPLLIKML